MTYQFHYCVKHRKWVIKETSTHPCSSQHYSKGSIYRLRTNKLQSFTTEHCSSTVRLRSCNSYQCERPSKYYVKRNWNELVQKEQWRCHSPQPILQKVGEGDRKSQSLSTDLKEGTSGKPVQSGESLELSHSQLPGLASVPRSVHQSSLVSPIDSILSMPYPTWPSLGHIFCTLIWSYLDPSLPACSLPNPQVTQLCTNSTYLQA